MIDIVRPLKYEDPPEGTQTDTLPTEVNPMEDFVGCKGVVFDVSGATASGNRIYGASGIQWFHDYDNPTSGWTLTDLSRRIYGRNVANIDPSTNDLLAWDTASGGWYPTSPRAIPSASPGFTWGRSGNLPNNTYLLCDTVPSNIASRVATINGYIAKIFVTQRNSTAFTFAVETRVGAVFTTIYTGVVPATRKVILVPTPQVNVAIGDEICIRISNTGNPQDVDLGILLKGSIV